MTDKEELDEIKQEKAARIVYIALSVVIVLTMIISVASAINRRNKKTPPVQEPPAQVTETERSPLPQITKDGGKKPDVKPDAEKPPKPAVTDAATDRTAETEPETETVTEQTPEEPASAEKIFVVPVNGAVIKDYTMDMPAYSVTMNDYRVHNGTDFHAENGDPVCAFADGVVSAVYFDPMMGQTVVVDHGDGLSSMYQNLQISLPDRTEVGAKVAAGDVIAAVGETALIECAEVPHLHFSLIKDGAYIAPSDYLGSIRATEE